MQDELTTEKLYIGGMTCIHCQEKIESALNATQGITSACVSYAKGTADVTYDGETVSKEDIVRLIENLDYRVIEKDADKTTKKLLYPFLIFAVIIALYIPLQSFGILNYLAPSGLADSSMGYGMLFVTGLATSVHCVAMCGGINISQCIPKSETAEKGKRAFLPALLYNAGRICSYTVIGFIFGLIGFAIGGGDSVGISSIVQGVFKIAAGLLMIVMGVNMLGIVPGLRKINPTLPKFLSKRIGKKKSSTRNSFLVGLLNGIMPCGPLQSMWLVALASGNPFSGALAMFLFALGTTPLMLGLGAVVSKLGQKFTKTVMVVGSLLVVVLGLAMLSQGGSLTGFAVLSPAILAAFVLAFLFAGIVCSMPVEQKPLKILLRGTSLCLAVAVVAVTFLFSGSGGVNSSYDVSVVNGDSQTVTSTLEAGSYPKISVKKDIPVVWVIDAPEGSINGCNYKIIISEYDLEYEFSTGENVIEFTPTKAGTYSYCCWMGMIYGTIVVTS